MTLWNCLQAALASLRANKLRTGLTTLGIIIGVAAVIAMVGVGKGAEKRIQEAIQGLGENVLFVRNGTSVSGGVRGGANSKVSLTEADAAAIEDQAIVDQNVIALRFGNRLEVGFGDRRAGCGQQQGCCDKHLAQGTRTDRRVTH